MFPGELGVCDVYTHTLLWHPLPAVLPPPWDYKVPILWTLCGNGEALAWRDRIQLEVWVSRENSWCLILRCPLLPTSPESLEKHKFFPNWCVQGKYLYVEVAARGAPHLYTPYSTLGWKVGFSFHFIFGWLFCSDPWKAACCHLLLLSCPFAVTSICCLTFLGCKLFKMLSAPVQCLAQSFFRGQWGI